MARPCPIAAAELRLARSRRELGARLRGLRRGLSHPSFLVPAAAAGSLLALSLAGSRTLRPVAAAVLTAMVRNAWVR